MKDQWEEEPWMRPSRPDGDNWATIASMGSTPNYYETLNALKYGYTPQQLRELNSKPGFQHGQSLGYGPTGFQGGPGAGPAASAANSGAGGASQGLPEIISGIPAGTPQIGTTVPIGGAGRAGGSFLSKLLSGDTLLELGKGLGSISQANASNRGTELDAMMEGDRNRILLAQDRRNEETDLWRKMQAAEYVKGGGVGERTPMKSVSGREIPQFGFGPKATTDLEKQVASELEAQLMERLRNPMKLSDYASKMKPGTSESILNWAGPATSVLGRILGGK